MAHFALNMNSLSAFLATVAIKGALLIAAALISALLCRRAVVRHQILSCAMLALVALPISTLALPSYSLHLLPAGTREVDPDFGSLKDANQRGITMQKYASEQSASAKQIRSSVASNRAISGSGIFGFLFLAGCAVILARMMAGAIAAKKLLRTAQPIEEESWQSLLGDAMRKLDLRQPVGLYETAETAVPLTLGIRRPIIVLPSSAQHWPIERKRCVLLHELAHIERRDCLLAMIAQFACALHFANPLVWIAERMMRRDRELAADDRVLSVGVRPSTYATELLDVARGLRGAERASWVMPAATAMAERSKLEGRLRSILDPRADHRPLGGRDSAAMVLLAIAILLPISALRGLAAPPAATAAGDAAIAKLRTQLTDALTKSLGKRPARIELTLDPVAQSLIEEELDAITQSFHPRSANIVVMAPQSGAILGIGSRGGAGNAGLVDAFEPASTIKVFTIATALDAGAIKADQSFATDSDASGVRDASPANQLDVAGIFARSSNIGTLKIYRLLGKDRLAQGFARFHFGEAPPIELATVAGTAPTTDWPDARVQAASFGHQMTASPLQIAAAFSAVANHGSYRAPQFFAKAVGTSGEVLIEHNAQPEQVVSAATADTVLHMLEGVVQRDDGTGTNARIAGIRVAGKTGTGDKAGLFVGAVPADAPAFVILVAAGEPQGTPAFGNVVAAPTFRRIAEKLLASRHMRKTP